MNDTQVRLLFVAALLVFVCASVQATTWTGGMLYERFGVTLEIEEYVFPDSDGKSVYRFINNSWEPTVTPHPLVGQFYYAVNDFYGWPSDGDVYFLPPEEQEPPGYSGGTVINDPYSDTPTWPSGGEMFDTEAIYMTNDAGNIYIAIVTSMPPPPGFYVDAFGVTVSTGDLAIHTHDGEDWYDYWYGVDINLADWGEESTFDPDMPTDIGQGLYRTEGEGWYTTNAPDFAVDAPHPVTGESPDTNFYGGGMPDNHVGDVIVKYLQTGLQEGYEPDLGLDLNLYSTWEVNITIPLALLPEYYSLKDGESRKIGFHFVSGCRNDGNADEYILRLDGEVHAVPEPGTLALTALGLLGLAYLRKRRMSKAEQA